MIQKKRSSFLKTAALILICVLLCSAAGAGSAYYVLTHQSDGSSGSTVKSAITAQVASSSNSTETLSASDVYTIAKQQTVAIQSTSTTTNVFGQESTNATAGSGFIISSDGYIMTNYHVISYAVLYNYDLSVTFSDGSSYPAEIIGYYSDNDVAIIKIDANNLSPVTFGNSDEMLVGERVYCVGNPLGELDFTMTSGIVSALDRIITTDTYTSINMFQLDAAVNSGNSGGPVFDDNGNVIGIVTAKYSESGVEGLGFAIPINDAVTIATELIENGYVTGEASLGISAKDIEAYVYQYYNIPAGVHVYSVNQNSTASDAGIQAGDIITAIDDQKVSSVEELKSLLKNYNVNDTVKVTLYRSGTSVDVNVVLEEKVPSQAESSDSQSGSSGNGYNYNVPSPFSR